MLCSIGTVLFLQTRSQGHTGHGLLIEDVHDMSSYLRKSMGSQVERLNGVIVCFRLGKDDKNPLQDCGMVLVLRDSTFQVRLPHLESSFLAGLLQLHTQARGAACTRAVISTLHAQLPLMYPGAFSTAD